MSLAVRKVWHAKRTAPFIHRWFRNVSMCAANPRLALMGPPGSGKTTVGRKLAKHFKFSFVDADDDILQPAWGCSVAEELSRIGPTAFLEKEGTTCLQHVLPDRCVLALTGSNPLHADFMKHLHTHALVIYLDVQPEDILGRLQRMKVDRIVGQTPGRTMADILAYRAEFYERYYHLRVLCGSEDDIDKVLSRVLDVLRCSHGRLLSSRYKTPDKVTFGTALRTGLAPDGGLFTPQSIPTFDYKQWQRLVPLSFPERCLRILQPWIDHMELPTDVLREAIATAYESQRWSDPDICPVHHLEGRTFVQELFHGPTASFKDLALSLMAECLSRISHRPQLLLVATSGDTGSAVLSAFSRQGWPCVVLYPRGGVSAVQRLCMTQFQNEAEGRWVCGVNVDFDACQSIVKTAFSARTSALNGANSLNWGRLLPQVAFHCSGYLDLVRKGHLRMGEPLNLAIPSGNFGDAMSAFYAKMMGLPLGKILCANNENAALADFLRTGRLDLRNRKLIRTASPAIDILCPSNIERLIMHFDPGAVRGLYASLAADKVMQVSSATLSEIQEHFVGASVSHEQAMASIVEIYQRCQYLIDPHTAVAAAARSALCDDTTPLLLLATAHPGKFAETVSEVVGGCCLTDPHQAIAEIERLSAGRPKPHPGLRNLPASEDDITWSPEKVSDHVYSILSHLMSMEKKRNELNKLSFIR